MKRWKILSRFDHALSHPLPLVLGAWLILSSTRFPVTVFALTVLLYASIARDDSWLVAAALLACFLIPTGFSSETMLSTLSKPSVTEHLGATRVQSASLRDSLAWYRATK